MKAQIAIDGGNSTSLAGTVAEIDPAADPTSHSFLVKIDLPSSSQLCAGMYGTAEFANGVRQAIVIPRSAVVMRGSLACAYVLDSQGIAQLRSLTLARHKATSLRSCRHLSRREARGRSLRPDLAGKRIEVLP